MGRYKNLGSLKSFIWYVPQLSGTDILFFTSWVFSGLTLGSGWSLIAAKVKVKSLSRARPFVTPWIVACTKLLCPWDFQGKSTAVGCRFLLRGIFPTQGSNQVSHIVDRRFTVWATLGTLKSYKKLRSCPQSTKPISVVGLYHHFSKLLRWGFDNRRQI